MHENLCQGKALNAFRGKKGIPYPKEHPDILLYKRLSQDEMEKKIRIYYVSTIMFESRLTLTKDVYLLTRRC